MNGHATIRLEYGSGDPQVLTRDLEAKNPEEMISRAVEQITGSARPGWEKCELRLDLTKQPATTTT